MWPDGPVRYSNPDSELKFSRIWAGSLVQEPILNVTVKPVKFTIPAHRRPAGLGHIFTEWAKFHALSWTPVYRPFFPSFLLSLCILFSNLSFLTTQKMNVCTSLCKRKSLHAFTSSTCWRPFLVYICNEFFSKICSLYLRISS